LKKEVDIKEIEELKTFIKQKEVELGYYTNEEGENNDIRIH
jgi:hypothetical protein